MKNIVYETAEISEEMTNARNYHKIQMIKDILHGMSVHASNVFEDIENIYSSGDIIPEGNIEELIKDVRRDISALELYMT